MHAHEDADVDTEFDEWEPVEWSPDFRIVLEIPFEPERMPPLHRYADAHGINAIQAVQRLVDEGLAAHAKR